MAENSPLRVNSFGDAAAQLKDKMVAIGERYVRDGRGGGTVEPNPDFAKQAYEDSLRKQGQAATRAGAMQMNAGAAPAAAPLPQTPAAATIPAQPTGAPNATAGAAQTQAGQAVPGVNNSGPSVAQPAGQPSGGSGAVPGTEVAKQTALRGYLDGAKGLASNAYNGATNMASRAGQFLSSDAGGGLMAAGVQAYKEAPSIRKVFGSDQVTDIDKGTQLYEGIARSANVGAGSVLGAKVGLAAGAATGPLAPVAMPVLGTLGGVAGGYFGNYATDSAIRSGRTLAGTDTASPADRLPTEPAAPTRIPFDQLPQASYSNEGRNYRKPNPALREQYVGQKALDADLKNPMSNASLQKVNPGGQVMKDGNTYSGGNVSGLVSLTDSNGKALPGQPGGGMISGSGDGSFRFASPDEMARYKAEKDGLRNGGNTFQDAVNARLRGMGVNSERDLSTRTLSALYGAVQTQLGDKQAAATNLTQQENNRQMSLDRQLQATSAERVKQMEINQLERKRQIMQQAVATATPRGKDGKPAGEADRTLVQQYLADHGFSAEAEAQGKLVRGVQEQAGGANDLKDKSADAFRKLFAGKGRLGKNEVKGDEARDIEANMANEALRLNPNLLGATREAQGQAATEAAAQTGLRMRLDAREEGGWESLLPTKLLGRQKTFNGFDTLPDPSFWQGAKLSAPVGGLRGALTPNLEAGDQYVTLGDGSTLNLGGLDATQVALVHKYIQEGNAKAQALRK